MSTVLLDRLDEEFMTGVQDIEPSREFFNCSSLVCNFPD